MLLYHYTAREFLDAIQEQGISKGEVPLTQDRVINGVWLTSNRSPVGHGLTNGGVIPPEEVRLWKAKGLIPLDVPDDGLTAPNKRAVRITVKINSADRDLWHWPKWGRKRLAPKWYDALTDTGGGSQKARSWYVCFRTLKPSEFVAIDFLE